MTYIYFGIGMNSEKERKKNLFWFREQNDDIWYNQTGPLVNNEIQVNDLNPGWVSKDCWLSTLSLTGKE